MTRIVRLADGLTALGFLALAALAARTVVGGVRSDDYAYEGAGDIALSLAFIVVLFGTAFAPLAYGSVLARRVAPSSSRRIRLRPVVGQGAVVALTGWFVAEYLRGDSSTSALALLGLPVAGAAGVVVYVLLGGSRRDSQRVRDTGPRYT